MVNAAYQNILVQVKQLNVLEQFRLLEAISQLVQRETVSKPPRSIRELRGLGKEVWKNVDAQEYVNQERVSWE
ncbi:hypothetical protein U27_03321 [Candidatus Vecturithrix granuli]|uniref:Uncharacterized protein n=1 Tax=Vecturithrix granuli TaxID=1499967 RepID=A0A081BVK4_VECG1|nr:hypothetical protein U27_03321 [Candidatus Vecturithrix granuli]